MKLKDRVAIVTGGGTGIGKAVSLAFADEGAAVVVAFNLVADGQRDALDPRLIGRQAAVARALHFDRRTGAPRGPRRSLYVWRVVSSEFPLVICSNAGRAR